MALLSLATALADSENVLVRSYSSLGQIATDNSDGIYKLISKNHRVSVHLSALPTEWYSVVFCSAGASSNSSGLELPQTKQYPSRTPG